MDQTKEITKLANMFSVLGDPTRLKIVLCLMEKEASVTEIVNALGLISLIKSFASIKYVIASVSVFIEKYIS